jgi:hypothetical protein
MSGRPTGLAAVLDSVAGWELLRGRRGQWRVAGGFGPSPFGWYNIADEQRKLGGNRQVVVAAPLEVAEPLR